MPTNVAAELPGLEQAWRLTQGEAAVVAIVDEDVDVDGHPEFERRVLPGHWAAPLASASGVVRRPHGTKVAGLVLGGGPYVTGVAPAARLLPVAVPALSEVVGHSSEGDGLLWAACHGADVICCAWSPPQSDGTHRLAPATRDALDHCLTAGRDGRGCIVIVSAGNDGCDVSLNGYATHPGVVVAGACNASGRQPANSGWGDPLWCVAPSNDPRDPVAARATYVTTLPAGSFESGDAYYTSRFGFTSAACAVVAGICALIVSANSELTSVEVKHVLRDACDKIDLESGTYDGHGHSPLYGYGRPDVARAVHLAAARRKPRTTSV
jgi:subtilisin family serine protease